jgi:nickel-dependent lactate racemase
MTIAPTIDHPVLVGAGHRDRVQTEVELNALIEDGLKQWRFAGRRVLMVIPDSTRTVPLPLLARLLRNHLEDQVAALDWLVALGTHAPMADDALHRHLGLRPERHNHVVNHAWSDASALTTLGRISAEEIAVLSDGLLRQPLDVRINNLALTYDTIVAISPVFPHEVVGFSGGNKYFFPGISGPEIIDLTHWLGALLTSHAIIGTLGDNPVRKIIDRAAAMIPTERRCIAMTIRPSDAAVHGLWLGSCEEAWTHAAHLSSQVHIRYLPAAFSTVLSVIPEMYPDMWTAAKGMYKLEPVVADGGEIILYAPHIHEFSTIHGPELARIGYHCRDYFLAHWLEFEDFPRGLLAHSTHLRGVGTYDPIHGERCRIKVTLATSIPKTTCEAMGLGWRDPTTVDPDQWKTRPGTLVVQRAGEILHRLAPNVQAAGSDHSLAVKRPAQVAGHAFP